MDSTRILEILKTLVYVPYIKGFQIINDLDPDTRNTVLEIMNMTDPMEIRDKFVDLDNDEILIMYLHKRKLIDDPLIDQKRDTLRYQKRMWARKNKDRYTRSHTTNISCTSTPNVILSHVQGILS